MAGLRFEIGIASMGGAATLVERPAPERAPAAGPTSIGRGWAFLVAFALGWVSVQPFEDLSSSEALDLGAGRVAATYFAFAVVVCLCVATVAKRARPALAALEAPSWILLAVWLALTCLTSGDPSTAAKRAALSALVATIAATTPLLPRGRAQLAALLAWSAGFVLALSYFGVAFMPASAIHQASDAVEPGLAGDWRGVFGHKNDASLVMGALAFVGVYVWRSGLRLSGGAICAASLIFLVFTRGKTAIALWLPTLVLAELARTRAAARWWPIAALTPLVVLTALGIGAVMFEPLATLVASLPIDASFTGRADIWRFALAEVPSHWMFGYGDSTFWNSPEIRFDWENGWTGGASHAHNGYLDATLSFGLPGLMLVVSAFVFQPLSDIRRAARSGADPPLLVLLAEIWLFGITASSLETFMFLQANPMWFTFLFAVFALRYLAKFPTRA